MFGDHSFQIIRLFGNSVRTNLEAILIMLATGFSASSRIEGAFIVASFAIGTGLHLGCHWLVALAYGKGIDQMVLTRAGRIDYSGPEPGLKEGVLRTLAGPSMNALCAAAGYALVSTTEVEAWDPIVVLALSTFISCSLILTAINFLPAIPFDGGLVLRAFLSHLLGESRGLQIAVWTSLTLLALMAVLGGWLLQPVLIYLALTIGYDNWQTHLRKQTPTKEDVGH